MPIKEFIIVILMANGPPYDAIKVTHVNGESLSFSTEQECLLHVSQNLTGLSVLAKKIYGETAIESINCLKRSTSI